MSDPEPFVGDGTALKASGILSAVPTVAGPLTLAMLTPAVKAVRAKPRPFIVPAGRVKVD